MAGDFAVNSTVSVGDLDPLWNAGLELDVLIDCSHNQHFQTTQGDGTVVVAKGIEIDMRVSRGTATQQTWNTLAASAAGATLDIVNGITNLGGYPRLEQAAVKVEIPNIGTDIFDPGSPSGDMVNAVAACQADQATFDTMDDWQRKYFGMYRWPHFENLGWEEEPRTRAG